MRCKVDIINYNISKNKSRDINEIYLKTLENKKK